MGYGRALALACACAVLLVGAIGCGCTKKQPAKAPKADPVVATVDGHEIVASALVREYESVPIQRRPYYTAHRDELLDYIVNRMVIVAEARAAGLESDPTVREGLRDAREFAAQTGIDKSDRFDALMRDAEDHLLIVAMRKRVLAEADIAATDEEARALAAEVAGGDLPSEFIELRAIANPDRAQVEKALEALEAGKPFDEVHAAYSADKRQHLATYSDTALDTMPAPLRTAIEGLKDGERSDIIEMDGRYLVVQVARRPAVVNLEPWRRQLLTRKQDERFLQWVTERRAAHRIVVNTKRLDEVQLPKGTPMPAPPEPTPAGSSQENST